MYTHADLIPDQLPVPPPPGTQRFFFALDSLAHPALAATPASRFFRNCWKENLHYDVDSRQGVIFNLSDKYLLGTLSVVTVGMAPHHVMTAMKEVCVCVCVCVCMCAYMKHTTVP